MPALSDKRSRVRNTYCRVVKQERIFRQYWCATRTRPRYHRGELRQRAQSHAGSRTRVESPAGSRYANSVEQSYFIAGRAKRSFRIPGWLQCPRRAFALRAQASQSTPVRKTRPECWDVMSAQIWPKGSRCTIPTSGYRPRWTAASPSNFPADRRRMAIFPVHVAGEASAAI